MPRPSTKPSELTINTNRDQYNGLPSGPKTSPMRLETVELSSFGARFEQEVAAGLKSLPPLHPSPPVSPISPQLKSADPPPNFLGSFKSRTNTDESLNDVRQGKENEEEYRPGTSSMSKIYHLRKNPGSTPELSLVGGADTVQMPKTEAHGNSSLSNPRPRPMPHHSEDSFTAKRREKTFRLPLSRGKSIREDSNPRPRIGRTDSLDVPPKTAPAEPDWSASDSRLLEVMHKPKRGKSSERAVASESEDSLPTTNLRAGLKAGGKNVMSKAKTGGGLILNRLGKIARSGSHSHEKEIPDSEYEMKIIYLPLIEQTRITRISKQLSGCRDKTEYWMSSLPYRAIDYLNSKCEVEGLYRIPGSGPQVKHWQRRFDTEIDVDLLSQEVLDPNEIASLLKSWLREQPSEIMPAHAQKLLSIELEKENPHFRNVGQPASQLLRDALSDLPPFNYYLLFAITCHLSLLLANKDRNRMDLNNLAVCVGPCLNLDRWLFNYLVGDWRHCWQGCYTEKDALEIEKMVEQGDLYHPPPSSDTNSSKLNFRGTVLDQGRTDDVAVIDDRAHSSGSSKPGSSYEDARPVRIEKSAPRNLDNFMIKSYTPIGAKIYGNPPSRSNNMDQNVNEPASGDMRKNSVPVLPSAINSGDANARGRHSRTQSEVPATPGKSSMELPIQHPSP